MNSRISDGKFSMFFYGCLYKIKLVWCFFFRARVQVNLRWYFSKYNIIFHCIRLSKILAPLHTNSKSLEWRGKISKKNFSKILFLFFQFCYEELIQYRLPPNKTEFDCPNIWSRLLLLLPQEGSNNMRSIFFRYNPFFHYWADVSFSSSC